MAHAHWRLGPTLEIVGYEIVEQQEMHESSSPALATRQWGFYSVRNENGPRTRRQKFNRSRLCRRAALARTLAAVIGQQRYRMMQQVFRRPAKVRALYVVDAKTLQ